MGARVIPKAVADRLKGFTQHGARLRSVTGKNARGKCPFCGAKHAREALSVHVDKLIWKCNRCGLGGGFGDYLAEVVRRRADALRGLPAERLAGNRMLKKSTLKAFCVGWDVGQSLYTVPVRAGDKVSNIQLTDPARKVVFSTVGGRTGIIRAAIDDLSAETVWVCEGWDAMVMWQALRSAKMEAETAVGIVGAGGACDALVAVARDKHVVLALDHDDAGRKGDSKARELLEACTKSIQSVHWPPDYKPKYDVRDAWQDCERKPKKTIRELRRLLSDAWREVAHVPGGDKPAATAVPKTPPEPTGKGLRRSEVIRGYRKWLHLPNPEVLDVVFGTALANRMSGDPLWLFLVGPPGCGKSAVLMSLANAPKIIARTRCTRASLVSGSQTLGATDPSLIPRLNGKVLIVKDFTTILKAPEASREEIFGVLRDAYDGKVDWSFGTGLERHFASRFGIMAGVTKYIEQFGPEHSVLGERFIKYYMHHDKIAEDEVAVRRAIDTTADDSEAEMNAELAGVAERALDRPVDGPPRVPEEVRDRVLGIAQWAAKMRGAVPRDRYRHDALMSKPTSEVGTRVARQLTKLAMGIALFRGQRAVRLTQCDVLARIARMSAPDILEEIVGQMYVRRRDGWSTVAELCEWTKLPEEAVKRRLENARLLSIAAKRRVEGGLGAEWQLTRRLVADMQPLGLYAKEKQWQRR